MNLYYNYGYRCTRRTSIPCPCGIFRLGGGHRCDNADLVPKTSHPFVTSAACKSDRIADGVLTAELDPSWSWIPGWCSKNVILRFG